MPTPSKGLGRRAWYVNARRQELGLSSQLALAEAAGVAKRTITQMETAQPTWASSMVKVAAALGWTPDSPAIILDGGRP